MKWTVTDDFPLRAWMREHFFLSVVIFFFYWSFPVHFQTWWSSWWTAYYAYILTRISGLLTWCSYVLFHYLQCFFYSIRPNLIEETLYVYQLCSLYMPQLKFKSICFTQPIIFWIGIHYHFCVGQSHYTPPPPSLSLFSHSVFYVFYHVYSPLSLLYLSS